MLGLNHNGVFNFRKRHEPSAIIAYGLISNLETQVFGEWFKDFWKQAGGDNAKVHSYFSFHDYDNCFDLQNNKWA